MNAPLCLARAALRHSRCALRLSSSSSSAPRLAFAAYHSYSLPTGAAPSRRGSDIHETPITQPEPLPRVHETRPPPSTSSSRPSRSPEQHRQEESAASPAKPAAPPKNAQQADDTTAAAATTTTTTAAAATSASTSASTDTTTAAGAGAAAQAQPAAKPKAATRPRSKLRARKAAMKLTPAAVEQLRAMLDQPDPKLIKVGVRNRGCSGLAYHLEYVEKPGAFDETVEQDGVKVLIDSKALFSIIGSEMDWAEDKLNQRFVFRNPNIKEQCGCGESFMVIISIIIIIITDLAILQIRSRLATTLVPARDRHARLNPAFILALIAASHRTSFEKRVWTALCAVPRGRVTTYGRLAAHLARNSSGTGTGGTGGKAKGSAASSASPRAVGNALRRNPFALGVPCHRVVAADMALGGFKGKSLARDGEGITLDEKRRLLRAEGVRFDAAGRVLGTPWEGWA
ncbi:Iron sulfur assembly protein 1 [Purpureocillium lavendulum]|uniref:Iron-sulfur assembly protein 1 n=1 Tax=Purpureocillium lavendulum TaxID=1247861 RepID=A0AB34FSB5_9HYPO|nr:Iron sulfur assembly protein 1 [Purpureocillium lavendulum]